MSIKEKLIYNVIGLLFLMIILGLVLIWLSNVFYSTIMFLMIIVIVPFAYVYHFDSIFKIHYQTETNPTEPNNSTSAEEIKTLSFILLVIWNTTS